LFYSITSIIGLGILIYIFPTHLDELFHIMIIFGFVSTATVFGRAQAYIILVGILAVSLPGQIQNLVNLENTLGYLMPFIVSAVTIEAILRIKDTTQQHIHRLETINKVSRQIMLSLRPNKRFHF